MDRELILHIGAGKTGTSSIQKCLASNYSILANNNIIVPPDDLKLTGKNTGQHVWYFANLRKFTIEEARIQLERDINILMQKFPHQKFVLSAENLSDRNGWFELFENIKKQVKVVVVLYIRRQDEYLLSAWQQWFAKNDLDFWAWILQNAGYLANWKHVISDWEKVTSSENIKVKVYNRQSLINKDVVSDFFHEIGALEFDGIDFTVGSEQNQSFHHGVLDFVEKNKSLFSDSHDNGFYNFVSKYSPSSKKISKHSTINHKQRMAILRKYAKDNAWIKDKYFPENQGHLFPMPKESDYHYLSESEISDLKWKTMMELSYNFYKGVNKTK